MKRLLLAGLTVCLVIAAAAFSANQVPTNGELQIVTEERNPWTNLRLNNDPADFKFAIVSDRTGGHRARVFSQAVAQLNLMQPEFVLSVGDLIEGYKKEDDAAKLHDEWKEFQGFVGRLQMPFFYVPGNHDVANEYEEKLWKEKFGRRYYHFVYRNVLFLCLNADDPPGKDGGIGPEQVAYFKGVLEQNRNVRWTVVALHRPLWSQANVAKNGWLEIEGQMAGRPYTVFAGHVHRYQKFVRNGQSYYQLATTGGGSKMRGVDYGEFDHIVWVTMKREGPVLANILLDGIYSENMTRPVTDEPGVVANNRKPPYPTRGKLHFEGSPTPGAMVTFYLINPADKKTQRVADGLVEPDGTFTLSSYGPNDGAPAGDHVVTVVWRKPFYTAEGTPGPNWLPESYSKPETTSLKATVKAGINDFTFEMKKDPPVEAK
ncbi:MAG: metallophosphoesterase [Gemmataceae bacterium]|nr:metallophosphoesterase [Gemmataceae bacterium]